ncbi:hypothetical protein GEMRC1_004263 [Eukaryota sp. GEM-RC1]
MRFALVKGKDSKWIKEYNPDHPTRSYQHPVHREGQSEYFIDHLNRKIYIDEIEHVSVELEGTRPPQFAEGEETKEAWPNTTHWGPVEQQTTDFTDSTHRSHVSTVHGKKMPSRSHTLRDKAGKK